MFTVLSNTRNANLYLIVAMTIAVVVLVTFAAAPSITMRGPALIPVTGSQQNAYIEFLHGEKALYANPVGLSDALSVYHLGEQAVYTSAVDSSNALSAWSLSEKIVVRFDGLESALLAYRQGEKDYK